MCVNLRKMKHNINIGLLLSGLSYRVQNVIDIKQPCKIVVFHGIWTDNYPVEIQVVVTVNMIRLRACAKEYTETVILEENSKGAGFRPEYNG